MSEISIILAGSDASLEAGMDPVDGETFRVNLRKKAEQGCLCLFQSASLIAMSDEIPRRGTIRLAAMSEGETFETLGARFERWTDDAATPFTPAAQLLDPRSIVKDFTSRGRVPSDVRPWLLAAAPRSMGEAYRAWISLATERLLCCLADQVSLDGDQPRYHFSGPPRVVLSLTLPQIEAMADGVQAAARWVYAEGRDAEPRHLLLANEWARASGSDVSGDVANRSLESAKTAYVAFVRSGSRETLKALAELRKGVVEETQKASQRAQDLAGALWKDLAIASAPFVLKVLPDSAKAANDGISTMLTFVAAAFLVYSFLVQTHINRRYFRTQRAGRVAWRTALGTILSPEELEDFGERPIRDSIRDYRFVRLWVGVVYAALIMCLLSFGCYETYSSLTQPAPGPTSSR